MKLIWRFERELIKAFWKLILRKSRVYAITARMIFCFVVFIEPIRSIHTGHSYHTRFSPLLTNRTKFSKCYKRFWTPKSNTPTTATNLTVISCPESVHACTRVNIRRNRIRYPILYEMVASFQRSKCTAFRQENYVSWRRLERKIESVRYFLYNRTVSIAKTNSRIKREFLFENCSYVILLIEKKIVLESLFSFPLLLEMEEKREK